MINTFAPGMIELLQKMSACMDTSEMGVKTTTTTIITAATTTTTITNVFVNAARVQTHWYITDRTVHYTHIRVERARGRNQDTRITPLYPTRWGGGTYYCM